MSKSFPYDKSPLPDFNAGKFDAGDPLIRGKLVMSGLIHEGDDFIFGHSRREPTFLELEQPRGTKIVDMNQSGHVVAAAGERQRIATFGLCGCTAVGVVATFPDGSRRAHVQHYDPFRKRMDEAQRGLEEMILIQEAEQGRYPTAGKVDAAIMIPGHGIHMEPDDPAHAGWLTETIRESFGEAATVSVAPYSMTRQSEQNPYATALVIDLPEQGSPEIFPGMSRIQTGQ